MIPDIGWQELLIIAILAIVVVGPKDLPRMLRVLGKWFGKARQMAMEFQRGFEELARESELEELRKEVDDLRKANPVNEIKEAIDPTAELNKLGQELKEDMEGKAGAETVIDAQEPAEPIPAGPAVGDLDAVAEEQEVADKDKLVAGGQGSGGGVEP